MKKQFLATAIAAFFAAALFGQETSGHFSQKNAIKLNPFGFARSEFQMSYERYFGKERRSALLLSPTILLKESNDESKEGYQGMAQYRFFLTHFRKDRGHTFLGVHNYGFYAGVYGLYSTYRNGYLRGYWDPATNLYVNEEFRKEVTAAEGGALLGLQIDVTKRILLDFYVGGGIKQAQVDDSYLDAHEEEYPASYGIFDPEYRGVKPKLGLLLGITF